MNSRERENAVLAFDRNVDRGPVQETFAPWTMTVDRWAKEGLPEEIIKNLSRTPDVKP